MIFKNFIPPTNFVKIGDLFQILFINNIESLCIIFREVSDECKRKKGRKKRPLERLSVRKHNIIIMFYDSRRFRPSDIM